MSLWITTPKLSENRRGQVPKNTCPTAVADRFRTETPKPLLTCINTCPRTETDRCGQVHRPPVRAVRRPIGRTAQGQPPDNHFGTPSKHIAIAPADHPWTNQPPTPTRKEHTDA